MPSRRCAVAVTVTDPPRYDTARPRKPTALLAVMLLVTAIAYYFAVVSHASLVGLLLGAYGGVAQIFPTLIATFYWRRATVAGALAGLLTGISVNMVFLLQPAWRPLPLHEGIYGLVANGIVLVVVSLMTKPTSEARLAEYSEPGWD